MSCKLQFKRGDKARLPTLAAGEPGWVTDEKKLYVGTGSENVGLAKEADLAEHAADTQAHKALLDGKADLVDGKVKAEQLPPIKTDQVVEQPDTPTDPNTILWVDPDEETPGVDIEGIRAEAELAHTTADSAITRLNGVDEALTEAAAAFKELSENLNELSKQVKTLSLNHNNLVLYLNDRYSAEALTLTVVDPSHYALYQGFGCRADGVLNVSANVMSENGFSTSQPEQIFYVEAPNSDYDLVSPQSFLGFMFDADNSRPLDRLTTIEVEVTSTLVNNNVRYLFTIKPNGSTTFTGNAALYISCGIALAPKKIPLID